MLTYLIELFLLLLIIEVKAIIVKCHSNNSETIPEHIQICNPIKYMGTFTWIIHNNHFIEEKPKVLELENNLQNLSGFPFST